MTNTTLCPCKECKDRYRACWGKCEKYIETAVQKWTRRFNMFVITLKDIGFLIFMAVFVAICIFLWRENKK